MKNILVVFNDKSGKKNASACKKLIYKKLIQENLTFKFVNVNVLPFLKDIEKYDTIIVVGGDGTINAVLPYLVNTNKSLGLIPTGTANLLAANLLIPNNASKALKIIMKANNRTIDAASAGDKYFILRLGFGYDADILSDTSQEFKNKVGYWAYFIKGAFKIFTLKNASYKIKLNDEKLFVSAGTIIIANAGNMFKNVFSIAPNGTLDDGELDVFIRRTNNVIESIEVFLRVIFKNFRPSSKIIYAKASNIIIKSKNKNFHIDGESHTLRDNLSIQVIPKSVKVFVP